VPVRPGVGDEYCLLSMSSLEEQQPPITQPSIQIVNDTYDEMLPMDMAHPFDGLAEANNKCWIIANNKKM
jgi:hypothetical protein